MDINGRPIKNFKKELEIEITKFGKHKLEEIIDYDHYVLWSAGTESTLILFELLELKKYRFIKGDIFVIVNRGTHPGRDAIEDTKREEIAEYVKEKYNYDLKENWLELQCNIIGKRGIKLREGKTLQWLFPIMATMQLPSGDKFLLYHGNNKEDDTNIKYHHAINAVNEIDHFASDETTKTHIVTIMNNYRKSDCIRRLIEIDPKIISMIATCETLSGAMKKDEEGNIIGPCGKCSKCIEFKRALVEAYKYEKNAYEDVNIEAYTNAIANLQRNRFKEWN